MVTTRTTVRGVRTTARRRQGTGAGAVLLCLLASLTGCSDHAADTPARPSAGAKATAASREIRRTDFADREWFDQLTSSTVTLAHGVARREADVAPGHFTWKLSGPPGYADADGDGHEDAVVGLKATGGQLVGEAWYIWLWRDGRVLQLRQPIVATSRCDRPVESVTAVPHGFRVRAFMHVSEDNCAGGGSVPITYVAAVRNGWPVQISPSYGPVGAPCDPRSLTVPLHPPHRVRLYTSQDVRSPAVEPAADYDEFLVDEYSAVPSLTPDVEWLLGIAVRGPRRVCGWARAEEVRVPS